MNIKFLKHFLCYCVLFFGIALKTNAQHNDWNQAMTEALIKHNKDNMADHKTFKSQQLTSQATVSKWKGFQNKMTDLSRKLKNRTNSIFIIVADATIAYDVVRNLTDMLNYQQKSLPLAAKMPWTIPTVIDHEDQIYKRSKQLVDFITMLVATYSDISQMKVSERKQVYESLRLDSQVLLYECQGLYSFLQSASFANGIKSSKGSQYINQDKEKVKEILDNLKW